MQKCEASDAVQIQKEVEEFHMVVDAVVSRLATLQGMLETGQVKTLLWLILTVWLCCRILVSL